MPLESVPQITPIEAFAIMVVGGVIYFLPGFIAIVRYHHNVRALFLFLVMLGWTGIGWIIALFWAMSSYPETDVKKMRRDARRRFQAGQAAARRQEKKRLKEERRRQKKLGNGGRQPGYPEPLPSQAEAGPANGGNATPNAIPQELEQIWGQLGGGATQVVQSAGEPIDQLRANLLQLVSDQAEQPANKAPQNRGNGGNPNPAQSIWGDLAGTEAKDGDPLVSIGAEDDMPSSQAGEDSLVMAALPVPEDVDAPAQPPAQPDQQPVPMPAKSRKCHRCRETVIPIDNSCPVCGAHYG